MKEGRRYKTFVWQLLAAEQTAEALKQGVLCASPTGVR